MTPAFRPPITKDYPLADRLAICDALGDLVDELVLGAMPLAERPGSGDRMVLARWSHAQTTYGAIAMLAREAEPDGQTVAMLSRPLFEAMVDTYWIARNPLKAQDLAVKHFRLLRVVVAEHYNERRGLGDPELPISDADINERAAFVKLFGSEGQKHWTTLDLRSRLHAVSADVPQDLPHEISDRYGEDNRLANLVLHGSPMAINDRLEGKANGVTVRVGATEQHLANGLRHAYWSYYRLGWLLVTRVAQPNLDGLVATYHQGWPKLQTITAGALNSALLGSLVLSGGREW